MTRPLCVVGDVLVDRDVDGTVTRLAPDAPAPVVDETAVTTRPGGAGLAAALAALDGRDVTLVTAVGSDPAGREVAALLAAAGVDVVDLGGDGPTAEKIRIRSRGRTLLRLDRGGDRGGPLGPLPDAAVKAVEHAGAVLVSDYGRGVAAAPQLRSVLAAAARGGPLVWDPHPRGPDPVPGARVVTPNHAEAAGGGDGAEGFAALTANARALARRWEAAAVAVTLGEGGALLVDGDAHPLVVPAARAERGDPCGAGDRFAASVAGALADGALPSEAVVEAVDAATKFVAAGGAGSVEVAAPGRADGHATGPRGDAAALARRVRARGGTVVATGGCFDLLHAGHVAMLSSARALGDCLIVLLNSDASVRRLKGPPRPVVGEDDRAAVLLGLSCVDAVAVFDEDTPVAALERVRPDVWAKGADYTVADLPEATAVESWGGQTVVLPYLEGRSTTRMLKEVLSSGND